MEEQDNYNKQLKRLLEVVNDGKEGYRQAAEQAHRADLKNLFNRLADERSEMANELKARLNEPDADADGDIKGAFHRAIMSLKTALATDKNDDQAILGSCREGDRAALDTFDDILQGPILNTELKPFITGLRLRISEAFNLVDKQYFAEFT